MAKIIQTDVFKFNTFIPKEQAIKTVKGYKIVMKDKRRKASNYYADKVVAGLDGDDFIRDVFTVHRQIKRKTE